AGSSHTGAETEEAEEAPRISHHAEEARPAAQCRTSNESLKAAPDVEAKLSASQGQGGPLPDQVRTLLEPRFGLNFSHVRVHTGSEAIQMNRALSAEAFTHGAAISLGAGRKPEDLELTAHELTHVVQQTGGTPLHPAPP